MIGYGDATTYVWRDDDGKDAGFAQVELRADQSIAHLLCVSATAAGEDAQSGDGKSPPPLNENAWLALLDGVVGALGRRGAHSIVAETDEMSPELILLRHAGFAIYTRQDIWALTGAPSEESEPILRPLAAADEWDVEWLYANTVPPLIQMVEPSPPRDGNIWVLFEEGELTAFVDIQNGATASWLQLFIHPNASAHTGQIIAAAVRLCDVGVEHPVYCCVRRYQSWVSHTLEQMGFRLASSQAVMVRHIAVPVKAASARLARVPRSAQARASTLLQRNYMPALETAGHRAVGSGGHRVRAPIDRCSASFKTVKTCSRLTLTETNDSREGK